MEERDFGSLLPGRPYWQSAVPTLHVSPALHVRVAIAPLPQHRTPVVPQGWHVPPPPPPAPTQSRPTLQVGPVAPFIAGQQAWPEAPHV